MNKCYLSDIKSAVAQFESQHGRKPKLLSIDRERLLEELKDCLINVPVDKTNSGMKVIGIPAADHEDVLIVM